jgi:hypothetical protein
MMDKLLSAFEALPANDAQRRSVARAEAEYWRGKVRELRPTDALYLPHADARHLDYEIAVAERELLERLRSRLAA